jgi:hypothetical protein
MAYRYRTAFRRSDDPKYFTFIIDEYEPVRWPHHNWPQDYRHVGSFEFTVCVGAGWGSPRGVGADIGPSPFRVLAVAGATAREWRACGLYSDALELVEKEVS